MNADQLMQMLQMGGQNEQLDNQMARQKAQAQQLRGLGANLGQTRGGRIQMAPGIAETLVGTAGAYMGAKADAGTHALQEQKSKSRQEQMAMLMRMLAKTDEEQAPPPGPVGPGMMPPTGPSEGMRVPNGMQRPQSMQGYQ